MNWINQSDHKLPELEGRPSGEVLGLCLHSWDRIDILGVSIDNEVMDGFLKFPFLLLMDEFLSICL